MQPLAHSHGTLTLLMMMLLLVFVSISSSTQTNATSTKKLDQTTLTATQLPEDTGIKCTAACSSCENLCGQQSPPLLPPPPPPPPKTPSSTQNCNPVAVAPPPPRFIYITGPPGDLYPLDSYDLNFYSGAGRVVVVVKGLLPLLVLCGVLQLLVLW